MYKYCKTAVGLGMFVLICIVVLVAGIIGIVLSPPFLLLAWVTKTYYGKKVEKNVDENKKA